MTSRLSIPRAALVLGVIGAVGVTVVIARREPPPSAPGPVVSASASVAPPASAGAPPIPTAPVAKPRAEPRLVDDVQWSPRGGTLALRCDECLRAAEEAGEESAPCPVHIWDLRRGRITATLDARCTAACPTCTRKSIQIAWSRGEERLAIADHGSLRVWRFPELRRVLSRQFPPGSMGFDFSPDGERILSNTEQGRGELIRSDDGDVIRRFEVDSDGSGMAFYGAWDRKGRHLVLSGDEAWSQTLPPMQIRDGRTGTLLRKLSVPGAASPRWIGDSARFVISNDKGLLGVVDAGTGAVDVLRPEASAPPGPRQSWAAVSHDHERIAVVGADSSLEIWDLATRRRRELLAPIDSEYTSYPQFSVDDRHLALVRGRAIEIVDAGGGSPPRRIELAEGEHATAVSGDWHPDGLYHARRGAALIAYAPDGAERSRRDLGGPDIRMIVRPDRRFAVLVGRDVRVVRLRDWRTLELVFSRIDGRIQGEVEGAPGEAALASFFDDGE